MYQMRTLKEIQSLDQFAARLREAVRDDSATLVEIGSFAGESTRVFAKHFETVYAVDPWKNGYDPKDIASKQTEEAEKVFNSHLAQWRNIVKMKMTGSEAAKVLVDNAIRIDVVYIDGEHSEAAVFQDILTWQDIAQVALSGHDYTSHWAGVIKAIHNTIGKPDVNIAGNWIKWSHRLNG